jgi:hypothetical protein
MDIGLKAEDDGRVVDAGSDELANVVVPERVGFATVNRLDVIKESVGPMY